MTIKTLLFKINDGKKARKRYIPVSCSVCHEEFHPVDIVSVNNEPQCRFCVDERAGYLVKDDREIENYLKTLFDTTKEQIEKIIGPFQHLKIYKFNSDIYRVEACASNGFKTELFYHALNKIKTYDHDYLKDNLKMLIK